MNRIHPEIHRNWWCCERQREWVHVPGVSHHVLYAEQQCGCSVLPCPPWLSFPLPLSWEAACKEGMILEKILDEVKDIFSCVSVWL